LNLKILLFYNLKMKILLLSFFLGVASILKIIHKNKDSEDLTINDVPREENPYTTPMHDLVDIRDFYTIKYKKYNVISHDDLILTPKEEQILNALKNGIDEKYTIRIVGGWVRDKVRIHIFRISKIFILF
jgi:hypothetical protein